LRNWWFHRTLDGLEKPWVPLAAATPKSAIFTQLKGSKRRFSNLMSCEKKHKGSVGSDSYETSKIIWVFPKIGGKPPKWMVYIWFTMENPIFEWMIWVENPLFSETSI